MQSIHTTINTHSDNLPGATIPKSTPIGGAQTRNLILAALISVVAASPAFGQFNGPVFETQKINSFDAAQGDQFGFSVDIHDGFVAVGERNASGGGCAPGFAYVHDFNGCGADLTGDGALNFFDIAAFINAFMANDLAADFNHNGMVDEADAPIFFMAYTAGCH